MAVTAPTVETPVSNPSTSSGSLLLPSADKNGLRSTAEQAAAPVVTGTPTSGTSTGTGTDATLATGGWKDLLTVVSIFAHQKGLMSTMSMVLSVLLLQGGSLGSATSTDNSTPTTPTT